MYLDIGLRLGWIDTSKCWSEERAESFDKISVSESNLIRQAGLDLWQKYGYRYLVLNNCLGADVLNYSLGIDRQGQDPGYCFITISYFTIFSCHFSGNKTTESLEESVISLQENIGSYEQVIVAGDFNTKSPQWGMGYGTDKSGDILTEWIATLQLVIANAGNKPTFESGSYTSIILDLTLVTGVM